MSLLQKPAAGFGLPRKGGSEKAVERWSPKKEKKVLPTKVLQCNVHPSQIRSCVGLRPSCCSKALRVGTEVKRGGSDLRDRCPCLRGKGSSTPNQRASCPLQVLLSGIITMEAQASAGLQRTTFAERQEGAGHLTCIFSVSILISVEVRGVR